MKNIKDNMKTYCVALRVIERNIIENLSSQNIQTQRALQYC